MPLNDRPQHQWLIARANTLAESTRHGYRRKIQRHILPTLGRIPIRRLKVSDLEALYDAKPTHRPGQPTFGTVSFHQS